MTSALLIVLGAGAVLSLVFLRQRFWSFAAQTPPDYVTDDLQFDIRRHLNGQFDCEGVIYGPLGRVSARFVAEFDVHWSGNIGVMKERFDYDGGATQHREWRLQLGNDGAIQATAPDVIGTGTGMQSGSAVRLQYRIRLPEGAGGHVLNAIDWMYMTPNGTIVNRSQFRKFGLQVAELVATMRPREVAHQRKRHVA